MTVEEGRRGPQEGRERPLLAEMSPRTLRPLTSRRAALLRTRGDVDLRAVAEELWAAVEDDEPVTLLGVTGPEDE